MHGIKLFVYILIILYICLPTLPSQGAGESPTDAAEQFELGVRYMEGRGVPQDQNEASRWFIKSAEQGYAPSQYNLGFRYEFGQGVAQSDQQAVYWYRKASQQGHLFAMNNYALLLSQGRGTPKDCFEAVRLFRQAAEKGFSGAQDNLGKMYRDGCGVEKDYLKAVQWVKIAAMNGEASAQTRLGSWYANGIGVPLNYEEAYYWLLLGARQGNQFAEENVNLYRNHLTPTQISRVEIATASFRTRTPEQQEPQIHFNEFTIQPDRISAGEEFELIVRYTASDPRVPYEKIPIDFHYELLQAGKVLLTSKLKTIQSPNNLATFATKRLMRAAKRRGTYTMCVYLMYGQEKGIMSKKDFVIE